MNAKNLFQFLTDQDHFYVTLVAISSVCQKLTRKCNSLTKSYQLLSSLVRLSIMSWQ
jgi:hypothetical protein